MKLPKLARKSITFDNGTEFTKHQKLTDQIGVKTWFYDPHSPIRRDMPRKTPLNLYTKKFAKAINYMLRRWPAFTRFLDDGTVCITNNAAERAPRGIALGRKS